MIKDFDYSKGGTAYVTKLSGFEAPNYKGKGLDSAENSNWKMSFNLKKRIKRINDKLQLSFEIIQNVHFRSRIKNKWRSKGGHFGSENKNTGNRN